MDAIPLVPHGVLFLLRLEYLKSHSDAGRWLIPAGHLCWVPPFTPHDREFDRARGLRIHLASRYCTGLPLHPVVVSASPLILAVMERLAEAGERRAELSQADANLVAVLRDEIRGAKAAPILLPMPREGRLRKVAERWLREPADPSGLEALAARAALPVRTLTRNFRRETGLSVSQWRQLARLMHAFELLDSGRPTPDNAFVLGYNSSETKVSAARPSAKC